MSQKENYRGIALLKPIVVFLSFINRFVAKNSDKKNAVDKKMRCN